MEGFILQALSELLPLLRLAQFLGLAPYSVKNAMNGLHLVPSKYALMYSSFHISFLILFQVGFIVLLCSIGVISVTNSVWESSIGVFTNLIAFAFQTWTLLYGVKFLLPTFNKLLKHLTVMDQKMNYDSKISNKKSWNAVIIIFCIIYQTVSKIVLCLDSFTSVYSLFYSIFDWRSHMVVYCVCHSFCAICLLLKNIFKNINHKILLLKNRLRNESCKELFDTQILKERKRKPYVPINRLYNTEYEEDESIAQQIKCIRRIHFLVAETCHIVEEIFSIHFILFFAYLFLNIVWNLFWAGMSSAELPWQPSIFGIIHSVAVVLLFAVLGTCVAATSGAVTAAAGDGTLRAAAALLVETCDYRQAERQAQMLVLQLRAHPVKFTAGGLFTMNLRFLVGFWGTIIGYFVVALQMAQSPPCKNK